MILAYLAAAAEQALPDDGYGLLGLVVIGLPSIITAGLSGVVLYRQRVRGDTLDAIKSGVDATTAQVVNGHEGKPALRSDVDRIIDAVDKHGVALAELRGEVKGLTHRVDLLTEK